MSGAAVSGPGLDRRVESAGLGISLALTHASRRAHLGEEDASYYVRDGADELVGRVDAHADGTVNVYGKEALDRASRSTPRGRGNAPRRSAGTSRSAEESEGESSSSLYRPARRRKLAYAGLWDGRLVGGGGDTLGR